MTIELIKNLSKAVVIAGIMMLPFNISAASFTGFLNSHSCATEGTKCPVDRLDPHIALEADFVLDKGDGDYYFLPNISRDIKVRYILNDVQVEGEKHKRYNSINVSELKVKKGDEWKTVWSPELIRKEWQQYQSRGNQ